MPLVRRDTPSSAQSLQLIAREAREFVNRLRTRVMKHEALRQLPASHIPVVRVIHGAHFNALSFRHEDAPDQARGSFSF